jgi:hypothetical protein
MLTSSEFSIFDNRGWADSLKTSFYTCRTWFLTQKWAAKPIDNKNDNTLKEKNEWQHTQEKY